MRLIDADALKNKFSEVVQYPSFLFDGIVNVIDRTPTAYDVEKVVERMEQAKYSEDDATSDNDILNFNCGVDECVGILKAGGSDEKR